MKELLLQYARYNRWANEKLMKSLMALDPIFLDQEIKSSFPSIRKTIIHLWSAENIWLQRLQMAEHPEWLQSNFTGNFEEIEKGWKETSKALISFIEKQYNDAAFEHVVEYYNLQQQHFKTRVADALMQVLNHGSQHRGQLITMLRQLNVEKIPSMDMIVYLREKR